MNAPLTRSTCLAERGIGSAEGRGVHVDTREAQVIEQMLAVGLYGTGGDLGSRARENTCTKGGDSEQGEGSVNNDVQQMMDARFARVRIVPSTPRAGHPAQEL